MAKKRIAIELGMGSSLRRADAMIVDVEVAVQKPEAVDVSAIAEVFPYGSVSVKAVKGGLDISKPQAKNSEAEPQITVMAQAAIIVSFDLPEKGASA